MVCIKLSLFVQVFNAESDMANDEKLYAPYFALFKVWCVYIQYTMAAAYKWAWLIAEQTGGGAATIERG